MGLFVLKIFRFLNKKLEFLALCFEHFFSYFYDKKIKVFRVSGAFCLFYPTFSLTQIASPYPINNLDSTNINRDLWLLVRKDTLHKLRLYNSISKYQGNDIVIFETCPAPGLHFIKLCIRSDVFALTNHTISN